VLDGIDERQRKTCRFVEKTLNAYGSLGVLGVSLQCERAKEEVRPTSLSF